MTNKAVKAKKAVKGRPVVVTSEWRGVFFGYLKEDRSPDRVILEDIRMCTYWSADIHGVLGLAATGPDSECRIGPKVPDGHVLKVTGVFGCTPEAATRWEAEPWK